MWYAVETMASRQNTEPTDYRSIPEERPDFNSMCDFFLKIVHGSIIPHDPTAYLYPPCREKTPDATYYQVEMTVSDGRASIHSIDTTTGSWLYVASSDHAEAGDNFLAILGPEGDGLFIPDVATVLDCSPTYQINRYRAYEMLQGLQTALVRLCYMQRSVVALPPGAILSSAPYAAAAHVAPSPQSAHTEPMGPYAFTPVLPGFEDI